jgi:hypothetical protein
MSSLCKVSVQFWKYYLNKKSKGNPPVPGGKAFVPVPGGKLLKGITFELDEIENLFDLYREELFELNREPSKSFKNKFFLNLTHPPPPGHPSEGRGGGASLQCGLAYVLELQETG